MCDIVTHISNLYYLITIRFSAIISFVLNSTGLIYPVCYYLFFSHFIKPLLYFLPSLSPNYPHNHHPSTGCNPGKLWKSVNKYQDLNKEDVNKEHSEFTDILYKFHILQDLFCLFFWLSRNSIFSIVKFTLLPFNSLLQVRGEMMLSCFFGGLSFSLTLQSG